MSEADIQQLAPRVLLKLLRAMSCVDMLREDSQDTPYKKATEASLKVVFPALTTFLQEYRAMCLSIVESGCAREEGFRLAPWLQKAVEVLRPVASQRMSAALLHPISRWTLGAAEHSPGAGS